MTLSIIALRSRNNKLEKVALELLGKAKRFYNEEINVIVPIGSSDSNEIIAELEQAGADKIFFLKNEHLEKYSTNLYREAILQALRKIQPDIILTGATTNGRDLAPRIASALQTGLTADCTELSLNEENKLAATRPTFGGSLMATILSRKIPQMATVRPKVFQQPTPNKDNKAIVEIIDINLPETSSNVKEINFRPKTLENSSLEEADIIVAAGRGIKTAENFKLLSKFAEKLGGKIAASRGLVDMKMCNSNIQIGQTGKTVTPKIYIACGISGATQHIEGMKGSQTIIAINNDPQAPIFQIADYKIIGDLSEILPMLIEEVKRN